MYSLFAIPVTSNSIDSFFVQTDIWDWQKFKPLIPAIIYYFPANGSSVKYGNALRTPVSKQIYWAGSERAVNGFNWMEGAIQRGNDATCEILADITIFSTFD